MLDFYKISDSRKSNGKYDIFPVFITGKKSDLMIKGGDFYAVWIEEKKLWSTDEDDVLRIVDRDLKKFVEDNMAKYQDGYSIKYMWDGDSGSIDKWHKYCKQQQRDNFVMLDSNIIFANQETTKESYASRKLSYPLLPGPTTAWDSLMDVLYSPEEKLKLEWAIGAVVSGDSKKIQKFVVLYGDKGTGKGTFLKILEKLFEGYCSSFEAKVVVSGNSAFPLEAFRSNPIVAIDSDGDLGSIGDNTRLNALTSHEVLPLNTKNEKVFNARINSFLFIGSNKPVKITDAKSGLLRRLIDVSPTGNRIPTKQYLKLMKDVEFELGAIASHCLDIYKEKPDRYDDYVPVNMMGITNDFYNFIQENYTQFKKDDGVTLKVAWEMYKLYCEDTNITKPFPQRIFRDELRNYFKEYYERYNSEDGSRPRKYYKGFRVDKFEVQENDIPIEEKSWIEFKEQHSLLDDLLADCPSQEAFVDKDGQIRPKFKWINCKTKLKDIDTSKLHYILPEGHRDLIRMDFDARDENGNKDLNKNLKEASLWPKTYAEISKSGGGIHLYYIYAGDISKLSNVYGPDIEIKTNVGNASIRRKLTKCNDIPIATISSGLPLKGDDKVNYDEKDVLSERALRTFIKRALAKEHRDGKAHTSEEVQFIHKKLKDKFESGESYDVSDMRPAVVAFAGSSSHQSKNCLKLVSQMKFKSADKEEEDLMDEQLSAVVDDSKIIFYDCEVFPNLLVICWSLIDSDIVHSMINPSPDEVLSFIKRGKLVGFNCRRYDNHILRAASVGKSNAEIFDLSQSMINLKQGFFPDAYDISYTDIWDYASNKQSLKKWEIKLKIRHKELNYRWDQPVPEDKWEEVASYCKNDVIATKATWFATQSDFLAREILADLTSSKVNDTTNTLTARLIFGKEKNPQSKFNYRNLALAEDDYPDDELIFTAWNGQKSKRPFFPSYKYERGKSTYRGEEVGEGGYVYAEPGIYVNVALLDITSMHPHSTIAERLFGDYTDIFEELVRARVYIKHAVAAYKKGKMEDYEANLANVRSLTHLGNKFAKYLDDYDKLKNLPQALKIAINSVYGLTAANFKNPFRDPRNIDNIVAKRGALFMIDLKHAVQERGFTVAHIKTDSIKIPNATPEIIEFVMNFGRMYGYSFELEDTYEKMALVNDAVYIAKYKTPHKDEDTGEDIWWTATGTQFKVPYVFKKLFSKQKIEFDDLCETKAVTSALYLDFDEGLEDQDLRQKFEELSRAKNLGADVDIMLNDVERQLEGKEHKYVFVGKVGQFCPIKPGFGGGRLFREKDGKFYAATGTTGYRWKEAEVVRTLGQMDEIDISYYDRLCEDAINAINAVGAEFGYDYNYLVRDEPSEVFALDSDDDLPF